jgi:hypothetical protein
VLTGPFAVLVRAKPAEENPLWRAYQLNESLRAVFAGDLDTDNTLLDR